MENIYVVELPLYAYRGDTFNKLLFTTTDLDENGQEVPVNLRDHRFHIHIRTNIRAKTAVLDLRDDNFFKGSSVFAEEYDTQMGNPIGTTLDELFLVVDADQMKIEEGMYVYDLEMKTPNGSIITPIRGTFTVYPDVTRDINYDD